MRSLANEDMRPAFFSRGSTLLLSFLIFLLFLIAFAGLYRARQVEEERCSGWVTVGQSSLGNGCAVEDILKSNPPPKTPVAVQQPSSTRNIRPAARPADKPVEPAAFDKDLETQVNKALQEVEIAIKAPKELRRGVSSEVFAVIKTRDSQDISSIMSKDDNSSLQSDRIKVLPVIQLILRGAELEISPADPDWRSLTRLAASTWVWTVKSDRDGPKNINIIVRGRMMLNGEERIIDLGQRAIPMNIVSSAVEIANDKLGLVGNVLDIVGRIWGVFAACATAVLMALMNNFRIFRRQTPSKADA